MEKMTYEEQVGRLVGESCVAVNVLLGDKPEHAEFIPIRPRMVDVATLREIQERSAERGLRNVATMTLPKPLLVANEPIDEDTAKRLADAFMAYLKGIFKASGIERCSS